MKVITIHPPYPSCDDNRNVYVDGNRNYFCRLCNRGVDDSPDEGGTHYNDPTRRAELADERVTDRPKIKALAPWFGGKRTLAPRIVEELGDHVAYWEPFCGSMAVLFAKPRARMETVNDLHGDLINLARVVADDGLAPKLFARCLRTLNTEAFVEEFRATHDASPVDGPPDLDRAWRYFTLSWQARNGSAGTAVGNITQARRYTHNGGCGGLRWRSAVESIPAWFERLRAVVIRCADGIEMLERIADQEGSALYIDPPYLSKGTKYVYDFQAADHERLAGVLRRFRLARVVVSYYDDPRLADLYPGWTKRSVAITKGLVNQGRRDQRGATKAPEVLLVNGPSYAQTPAQPRRLF